MSNQPGLIPGIGGIAGAAITPNMVGMPPGMNPPAAPSAPLFPSGVDPFGTQQPFPQQGQPPQHQEQKHPILEVDNLLKLNNVEYVQFLIRHATRSVRTILIIGNVIDFQTIKVKTINSLYIDNDGIQACISYGDVSVELHINLRFVITDNATIVIFPENNIMSGNSLLTFEVDDQVMIKWKLENA